MRKVLGSWMLSSLFPGQVFCGITLPLNGEVIKTAPDVSMLLMRVFISRTCNYRALVGLFGLIALGSFILSVHHHYYLVSSTAFC
ncbi:hypothetical protein BDV36DRAFT_245471 [Aspergillus pseudocaelatus]|uniref:Uncharacterized protein n=1 Tax=Aspergillus pseudocaelatus TaxID=1825620 RepID=A0ABQ6WZ07_9EURO|nr:hypothetical protein BDV36DRAFT_245471 [Aspergillus pseudocaelatus]